MQQCPIFVIPGPWSASRLQVAGMTKRAESLSAASASSHALYTLFNIRVSLLGLTKAEWCMIEIRRSAIVRHSPSQMFDLVNDVDAYPRRFNWCSSSAVLARDEHAITARLEVRLGAFTQSFTTRNTLQTPERIEMQLVEGPFKALHGVWTFLALVPKMLAAGSPDQVTPPVEASATGLSAAAEPAIGCKVALAMDFDYSGLMGSVLRVGFQKLADRMVDEFCREADRTYA
jgi:ribosome-associated toxin RatA of RatAB toxin-antitoxin module